MHLAIYFITYLLFLFVSSILITAFYCITRGYEETLPDGSVHRYGKILKGYYFFWFRQKGKKPIYYKGDELAVIVDKVREVYDGDIRVIGNVFQPESITTIQVDHEFIQHIPILRHKLELQFEVLQEGNNTYVLAVYWFDRIYVFPEWLRTVMAGCITCTPTIYGNIVYWTGIFLFRNSALAEFMFVNFQYPILGVLFTWLAYWLSLAWLNTILWNIYNK